MAKYEEAGETPAMEAKHHDKPFLRKAEKMAPMHRKMAKGMSKKSSMKGRVK